ncbi:hypothetical protein GCM10009764_34610 [Nocardia ninae]|uniref:Uncharacterized protein n=1 Tax=Nocardia ninae NBRC 108245 TaxID=1210091 RepID=A0A511MG60_9NOCA|nr:hypothetical protein NN4_41610 [Nocardia ninae NBRC 108245]
MAPTAAGSGGGLLAGGGVSAIARGGSTGSASAVQAAAVHISTDNITRTPKVAFIATARTVRERDHFVAYETPAK